MTDKKTLQITSGDIAGGSLSKAELPGEVFVWHDILYDGPRDQGWPDARVLEERAAFIESATGGGLDRNKVLNVFVEQYSKLSSCSEYGRIVLWFDACLFDQSMLCHVLSCLKIKGVVENVDLLCVDAFSGIEPFDGLGQMTPEQLISVYETRRPVTHEQFEYAETVDRAFALQDKEMLRELSEQTNAPIPWVPAAAGRWLLEKPDNENSLGKLQQLALDAITGGFDTPGKIMAEVSARDSHPHFWGDTTLWEKINSLADRNPPLVRIEGPMSRLPQWPEKVDPESFHIYPVSSSDGGDS